MTEIRGVILDIDGTLVDSNDAHAWAWQAALQAHGYAKPFAAIRPLIGMGGDKVLPRLIGVEGESEVGQKLSELRSEIFQERYLPTLQPFPGARDLLQQMQRAGLTLAVGSSAKQQELDKLLAVANITDLVQAVTSSDDADQSKPAPDIVAAALAKLAYSPAEVIMLGDTPYDIEAATRAGVAIIALRCGGWSDADLRDAVAIYDDPADLLRHYAASPLGLDHAVPA